MYFRSYVLAMLIMCCVCQDGELAEFVSACGAHLNTIVRGLCDPYGGTSVGKTVESDVSSLMPWANRWAREIVCDHRGSNPDCLCCHSFYGPCTPQEIIATFCVEPPAYLAKYVVKTPKFRE